MSVWRSKGSSFLVALMFCAAVTMGCGEKESRVYCTKQVADSTCEAYEITQCPDTACQWFFEKTEDRRSCRLLTAVQLSTEYGEGSTACVD